MAFENIENYMEKLNAKIGYEKFIDIDNEFGNEDYEMPDDVIYGVTKNENIDLENSRIKLNAPWDKGYVKAGTKMSQRSSGGAFVYNLKALRTLQTSWENISQTQSELSYTGNTSRFWHGTKYVKFAWYNNYKRNPNVTTDFKDIYIREVTQ